MRRRGRTYLVGAGSVASVVALAIAPAAGVAKQKSSTAKLVKCKATLTLSTPAGRDLVLPGQTPGKQFGPIHCKGAGSGLEQFSYKIPASGDEVGSFVAFFKNGMVKGKFDLVPQESSLGNLYAPTFGASSFAGALKHLSGAGAFAGAKGSGSAVCTSKDGLHFKCVEKL